MKNVLLMSIILLMVGTVNQYAQTVGETAPEFEANLLGGGTFKLKDQYAEKVVFVFLFGNGCPSCVQAGADIETMIYNEFKDHPNFTAIGLDTWDGSSSVSTVEAFKSLSGVTFPLGIKAGSVAAAYSNSYDHLIVVDRWGILVHNGIVVADNDLVNAKQAIIDNLPVATSEELKNVPKVNIFPNPLADILQIDAGDESIRGIKIFDMAGKRIYEDVYTQNGSVSTVSVSLGHLTPGFYSYAVDLGGSLETGKFLIQR